MLVRSRGVGLYPVEQCYDYQRPFWLPYFVNDFTESACLASLPASTQLNIASTGRVPVPTPPGPGAPGVPNVSMIEAPASGEEAAAAVQAVSNKQITDWQSLLKSFYGSTGEPNAPAGWWDKYGNAVLLVALGLGVIWAGKRI